MGNFIMKEVKIDFGNNETETVDVVIGDGKTIFDDNYPFDARIYFYFADQAEYDKAKGEEIHEEIGFRIIGEVN